MNICRCLCMSLNLLSPCLNQRPGPVVPPSTWWHFILVEALGTMVGRTLEPSTNRKEKQTQKKKPLFIIVNPYLNTQYNARNSRTFVHK